MSASAQPPLGTPNKKPDWLEGRRVSCPIFFFILELMGAAVCAFLFYIAYCVLALALVCVCAVDAEAQAVVPLPPTNRVHWVGWAAWSPMLGWDANSNLYVLPPGAPNAGITNAAGVVGVRVFAGNEPGQYSQTNTYVPWLNVWQTARLDARLPWYFTITQFGCDGVDSPAAPEISAMAPGRVSLVLTNGVARLRFSAGTNAYSVAASAADGSAAVPLTNGLGDASHIVDISVPTTNTTGFFLITISNAGTNLAQ